MIGSSPLAERPDLHPVHRANAVLRAALLNSTRPSAPPEDRQDVESLSHAIHSVMQGEVSISFPQSLAERLDALDVEDAFRGFEVGMRTAPWSRNDPLAGFEARSDLLASDALYADAYGPHQETAEAAWHEHNDGLGEAGELLADAPLDPTVRSLPPQIHVQALLREFRRRQRHASLLVAGSIATAILLTVGGFVLVANLAAPRPQGSDNRPSLHSTSVAWQKPAQSGAGAGNELAAVAANPAAKAEPLLMPALAVAPALSPSEASSAPQLILAASGRQIAFAPLLPSSHAGYLLIRGLPAEAKLSAGRQSESGTWLVKGDYLHDLTLSIGEAGAGDYPIEVYVLQSGDGPQARRSLVLRVEVPTPTYTFGPDMSWAAALLDVVPSAHAAEEPAAPAEARVLRERAKRLLDEGDIAAARLLLLHLAERGEGDAAYELARTFDREMLTSLGARFMDGDAARARDWYERASQDGNAKATERLKILASLSGTDPSD